MSPVDFDSCPSCHRFTGQGAAVCPHCGYPYNTSTPPPGFGRPRFVLTLPEEPPPPAAHMSQILIMWTLFLSSGIVYMLASGFVVVVNMAAVFLALTLACSDNKLDRVNGFLNLSLEAVAAVVCALLLIVAHISHG